MVDLAGGTVVRFVGPVGLLFVRLLFAPVVLGFLFKEVFGVFPGVVFPTVVDFADSFLVDFVTELDLLFVSDDFTEEVSTIESTGAGTTPTSNFSSESVLASLLGSGNPFCAMSPLELSMVTCCIAEDDSFSDSFLSDAISTSSFSLLSGTWSSGAASFSTFICLSKS